MVFTFACPRFVWLEPIHEILPSRLAANGKLPYASPHVKDIRFFPNPSIPRSSMVLVYLPTGRGVCPEGKPRGLTQQPSTIGKINLTSMRVSFGVYTSYKIPWAHGTIHHISIRVSFRVYTSYKIPRPHGTICKFLLGFHVGGFVHVIRPPRRHGTIHHISVRVSCRVYTSYKIPQSHAKKCHISSRVSFRVL